MQKLGGRLALVVLLLLASFLAAQRAPASASQRVPAIVASRSEVLVDMVVTDRHGYRVKNLRPDQVEVFDNGLPQKISSFRMVARSVHLTPQDLAMAASSTAPVPASALSPAAVRANLASGAFNLITLVFGSMTAGGRVLARRAADVFLRKDLGPDDYVAVYSVDSNLYLLQGFTRDRARLLQAVKVATGGSSAQFTTMSEQSERILNLRVDHWLHLGPGGRGAVEGPLNGTYGNNVLPQDTQASASPLDVGLGGGDGGPLGAWMAEMEAETLQFQARNGSSGSSRRMLFGLRGIVEGEGLLPGRKSLILFTQQLPVAADTDYLFRGLTAAANRSNVTFYVIDPTGLSEKNDNAQTAAILADTAKLSATQNLTGGVTPLQATEFSQVAGSLLTNRHMMMALASQTGGFELANTNDFGPWMKRIEGDIETHYELFYTSTWGNDGKFHVIRVKLLRPGLKVRARNGYYALPRTPTPILPLETPLFEVLHVTPAPHAFPLQQVEWIDPGAGRSTVAVASEFPLTGFTFHPRKLLSGPGVETRFTAMYLVQDMQGNIVRKASQDFPITGPLSLPWRNMIFVRHFRLAPGLYHLQTIVFDPANSHSTLQTMLLDLPGIQPGKMRLSSVAVVGRMEPVNLASGPLIYHGVRLIPAVSDAFERTRGGQVGVYFKLYPGTGPAPSVTLLFRRNGKLVARATPSLQAAGPHGAVRVLTDFALDYFLPGNYEVDVVARAGQQAIFRAGFFSVE